MKWLVSPTPADKSLNSYMMIKRMIATSLAFFFIITSSHSQNFEWAKRIGGPGYDQDIRIAKNVHGNVHFIGSFEGTIDFDPGAGISNLTSVGLLDVFILKLDSIGNFLWAKRIGGFGNDSGVNIAVDSLGNIYTFGHFTGTADFDPGAGTSNVTSIGGTDIFVSKLDPDGTLLWVKSFGGSNYDLSSSIAIDDLGNIYMTGTFTETVDFDPGGGVSTLTSEGGADIFILKLDSAGNFIWAKNVGGWGYEYVACITVDGTKNVHIVGSFSGTCDFDPSEETSNLTSTSGEDAFILKLNPTGSFLWAKSLGGMYDDSGTSIVVDNSGSSYTTGYFLESISFGPGEEKYNLSSYGKADAFIVKYDSSGNLVWATRIGANEGDTGGDIALDDDNNIYTIGSFTNGAYFGNDGGPNILSGAGLADAYIIKLNTEGDLVWAISIGGTSYDYGSSISIDESGNVYTTGTFRETVDFDPGGGVYTLTSEGANDRFILKLGTLSLNILAYNYGNAISVYPNPTKGLLNIDLSTFYDEVNVLIVNQIGQNIQSKTFRSISSFQTYIPGESGIYFIEINTGDKKAILRVVKE